jgi:hypothetical protein
MMMILQLLLSKEESLEELCERVAKGCERIVAQCTINAVSDM